MILLLETIHPDALAVLESAGPVVLSSSPTEVDPAIDRSDVRAILTRGRGRISADTFVEFPALEAVARCGAGLDNIDTDAAASAGVPVLHAPGSTTFAVAETAVLLMLGVARRVAELDAAVKRGEWIAGREGYEGVELRGKRLGVIGLGAIGRRVAALGEAFGMDVVGWSRSSRDDVTPISLDELVRTADVIQVCVALTPDTTGLLGAAEFAAMKPGAIVVNTARGAIVDVAALAAALDAGRLGGYGADVWDPEPPAPDDPVATHARVLVTPHVAGLTDVTYREICVRPARAVASVLGGNAPDPSTVFGSGARM